MTKDEVLQQTFTHSVDIQVRFTDMDSNGHINNGVYHSYYDLGRMHFFQEVLQAKKNNDNAFFKNYAQNDIAKCCSIELVEYVLKHYEILATIQSDWFTSQQNVLQSMPKYCSQ